MYCYHITVEMFYGRLHDECNCLDTNALQKLHVYNQINYMYITLYNSTLNSTYQSSSSQSSTGKREDHVQVNQITIFVTPRQYTVQHTVSYYGLVSARSDSTHFSAATQNHVLSELQQHSVSGISYLCDVHYCLKQCIALCCQRRLYAVWYMMVVGVNIARYSGY